MLPIDYYRPYFPPTKYAALRTSWRYILHEGCKDETHWATWMRKSYLPKFQRAQKDALILGMLQRGVFLAGKHYGMWNWLAETGEDAKINWPGFELPIHNADFSQVYPEAGCFACETTKYMRTIDPYSDCADCPIYWDTPNGTCSQLFDTWYSSTTVEARKEAARVIASRPIREGFPGYVIY